MANYVSTHTGAELDSAITKVEGVASLANNALLKKKSDGGFAAAAKSDITALGIPAQDTTYVFNTAYNASTNKAATMTDINNAIGNAIAALY